MSDIPGGGPSTPGRGRMDAAQTAAADVPLIRVEVTLKGSLADRLPGGRGPLEVPEGTTAEGVLAVLGVPPVHCIYVVNGATAAKGTLLGDGDRLLVYPPMAGGGPPSAG